MQFSQLYPSEPPSDGGTISFSSPITFIPSHTLFFKLSLHVPIITATNSLSFCRSWGMLEGERKGIQHKRGFLKLIQTFLIIICWFNLLVCGMWPLDHSSIRRNHGFEVRSQWTLSAICIVLNYCYFLNSYSVSYMPFDMWLNIDIWQVLFSLQNNNRNLIKYCVTHD